MYAPSVSQRLGKVCNTKAINAVSLETAIKTVLTEKINNYLSSGNTAKKVFGLLKNTSTEERKTAKKRIDEFNNNIRVFIDFVNTLEESLLLSIP